MTPLEEARFWHEFDLTPHWDGGEGARMSKSGLPPYDDMLYFLLRYFKTLGPKSRAAVISGDVVSVSERSHVRMLAHGFSKSSTQVARDLIRLDRTLETGR